MELSSELGQQERGGKIGRGKFLHRRFDVSGVVAAALGRPDHTGPSLGRRVQLQPVGTLHDLHKRNHVSASTAGVPHEGNRCRYDRIPKFGNPISPPTPARTQL